MIPYFLLPLAFFLRLALFPLLSFLLSLSFFPLSSFYHFTFLFLLILIVDVLSVVFCSSSYSSFPLPSAHTALRRPYSSTQASPLLPTPLLPRSHTCDDPLIPRSFSRVAPFPFSSPFSSRAPRPLRSSTRSFPDLLHSCFTCVPLSLRLSFFDTPLSLFLTFLSPRLVPDPDLTCLVLTSLSLLLVHFICLFVSRIFFFLFFLSRHSSSPHSSSSFAAVLLRPFCGCRSSFTHLSPLDEICTSCTFLLNVFFFFFHSHSLHHFFLR